MTTTVCFFNDGQLDKRSFTMHGLSAKPTHDAIGYFGTGFNNAIAVLLRHGCKIWISAYDGIQRTTYTFYTMKGDFRGTEHDFIYCHDMASHREFELPFTAHLGANWKLWQAYRELYTNARDEGGDVSLCEDTSIPEENFDVCVFVEGKDFVDVHKSHNKLFLKEKTIAQSHRLRCVEKVSGSDNVVYYKTMYTGTKLDKPSYFTYDYVSKIDLTEDRTIADTWFLRSHISELWTQHMSRDTLIEHLPHIANSDLYEYGLSLDYGEPSPDFVEACQHLLEHHRSMPMWARDVYTKSRPFNEQVGEYKLNRLNKAQLNKAISILHHNDVMIDDKLIFPCVSLPENVSGMYKNGVIYLAKRAFDQGLTHLVGTLYEEHLHHDTGVEDMTRKMQNMLIDKVARLMEQTYLMDNDVE